MHIQHNKEHPVASTPASTPSSYEQLGQRIQKIINSPIAQRSRAALIFRLEQETPEDWDTLLAEIAENDNVTLAHRDDGGVQIFWTVPQED
ncbi:DUF1654 domain-containing protein [Pseudomonas sichuanensis]|uniref:DUF1654 domain-containing protein n=1 Tax=Pseudomonas sichuanensis TaxID=2213015 RepID=UPI003D76950E